MTPIQVTISRLEQMAKAAVLVPIVPVKPVEGECIVVNRRYEMVDDNTHAVVSVSVYASSFNLMEGYGDWLVDTLRDGSEPWSCGDAKDVLFEKIGPDTTGFDEAGRYVRTIEFGVSW